MAQDDSAAHVAPKPAGRGVASIWRWLGRFLRLSLVVVILGASSSVAYYWLLNPPMAQRRPPAPVATLVEVIPVQPQIERVVVPAMGTVVPARKIQLAARVSGQIVEVNPKFVPGGYFRESERILQVDRKDYELAVEQSKGNLTRVDSDVTLEMGQQSVAQREYELLGQTAVGEDEELLLRQPQLAAKKAAVSVAQALLDKALLDLDRTAITSPFNAVVQTRNVDLGAYVGPGTTLATLVDTDEYWVEVSVAVDDLHWIAIPGFGSTEGSPARVYHEAAWGPDAFRDAAVQRLMTDLEPEGLMARLLVVVKDPLQLNAQTDTPHPLSLGSRVRVEIDGRELPDVVKVPRRSVREGTYVWVMMPDHTLDIREIQIVWSAQDDVCISDGLHEGDLLVTSDLGAPMPGMLLRTADEAPAEAAETPAPGSAT